MPAFIMDAGRNADAAQVRNETQEGNYRPVITKVTSYYCLTTETAEERRVRHAESTGTKRGMWK